MNRFLIISVLIFLVGCTSAPRFYSGNSSRVEKENKRTFTSEESKIDTLNNPSNAIESVTGYASFYADAFDGLPLRMNPEPKETQNGYWMPTVLVDQGVPFNRESLLSEFRQNNIDGRVFFWPLLSLVGHHPAQQFF